MPAIKRLTVFANGSDYADWTTNNCDRCVKHQQEFNDNACAIEKALAIACFDDGSVDTDIATRLRLVDGRGPERRCPEWMPAPIEMADYAELSSELHDLNPGAFRNGPAKVAGAKVGIVTNGHVLVATPVGDWLDETPPIDTAVAKGSENIRKTGAKAKLFVASKELREWCSRAHDGYLSLGGEEHIIDRNLLAIALSALRMANASGDLRIGWIRQKKDFALFLIGEATLPFAVVMCVREGSLVQPVRFEIQEAQ